MEAYSLLTSTTNLSRWRRLRWTKYQNCIWRRFKSKASAEKRKSQRDWHIRVDGFQQVDGDNIRCVTHLKAEEPGPDKGRCKEEPEEELKQLLSEKQKLGS